VFQRQLKEQWLARLTLLHLLADRPVVRGAVLDGVIENRGVGREPGDGQLVDVALEGAAVQQIAGDVVQPEALADLVKHLRCLHRVTAMEKGIVLCSSTERLAATVSSRNPSSADPVSISSVLRQRQLPSARPGTFIRASRPRLRTSWSGAIASAAIDD